ncbi:MAG TPA: hypothetical protein VGB77_21805 [Abditibacteriaceae bacterium]
MCMVLYVASDKPLPLIAWDENNPNFHVKELHESSAGVRKQFSKPYVYYLGSDQGCGCGFSYGQFVNDNDELKSRESVSRLSKYLSQAVEIAGPLELYSCWSGDEEEPPEFKEVVTFEEIPGEIGGEAFAFQEREFIKITN